MNLEVFGNETSYAKYSTINIGDNSTISVGGYSGTGDSLKEKFSAKDKDNDLNGVGNCAIGGSHES